MNMSFTDPNEIIHPNAESIPEYIRHFASAMFVNESFWNNSNAITEELQMERNTDNYISTYLSYINMLQTTYNLVTKGKISFFLVFTVTIILISNILKPPCLKIIFTVS